MTKLSKDCKKLMVEEISKRLNSIDTLIVTNYKGLTAQNLNELRKELRNISGQYVIVKDSMAKRALADERNNKILEFIEGEVGIVLDKKEDPTYILKMLTKFSKSHSDILKIRGGIIKGELVSEEGIAVLAKLLSREVFLGKLANLFNSPLQGLARVLSGIISKLVYALNAVKDKKPASKPEPRDAEPEPKEESVQPAETKNAAPGPSDTKEEKPLPKDDVPEAKPETKEEKKETTELETKEKDKKVEEKPKTEEKGTTEQKSEQSKED